MFFKKPFSRYLMIFTCSLLLFKHLNTHAISLLSGIFDLNPKYSKYMGSYLFCVNEKNAWDWHWAKPNLHSTDSWAPSDKYGFWLKGSLWILNVREYNMHSALEISTESSRQKRVALDANQNSHPSYYTGSHSNPICSKLVKYCTDSYGPDYTHVGASGYDLAITDWGYIKADGSICPNWDMPNGFAINDNSGMHYSQLLGNLTIDALSSGPLEFDGLPGEIPVSATIAAPEVSATTADPMVTTNSISKSSGGNPLREIPYTDARNNNQNSIQESNESVDPTAQNNRNTNENEWTTVRKRPAYSAKDKIIKRANELILKLKNNPTAFVQESNGRFSNFPVNGKKLLPENGIYYKFDIPSHEQIGRGKKRLVIDKVTHHWWYTGDHYISFPFSYQSLELNKNTFKMLGQL